MKKRILVATVLVLASNLYPALAQTLFSENFEGNLSTWVGQNTGVHHGIIVPDPLRPGNNALTFTALNAGGDIFSSELSVTPGMKYVLQFEYLGIPGSGTPDDLGGFIGFSEDTPNGHRWLESTSLVVSIGPGAGTKTTNAENDSLIDDGQWHSYSVLFDPFDPNVIASLNGGLPLTPSNNTIRIMVEDFDESGGVSGDALFDNIQLNLIPEPSTIFLAAIGVSVLFCRYRVLG